MNAYSIVVFALVLLLAMLSTIRGEVLFDFSHVDFQFNHKLVVTPLTMQQTALVDSIMACVDICFNLVWCKSGNLKTIAQSNGLHVCEVFSSDQYDSDSTLTYHQDYRHFRIKVSECDLSSESNKSPSRQTIARHSNILGIQLLNS